MHGTPVKSCMMTRAGVNWISVSGSAFASHSPTARMWSAVMLAPSSVRRRFSRSTLRLYGRDRSPHRGQAVDLVGLLSTSSVAWASKLFVLATVAPFRSCVVARSRSDT